MKRLNYQHLLYFWTVAREGSIARACTRLHLTEPTISGQLRALSHELGTKLFDRTGRNLTLTEAGQTVYRYADAIFSLGKELQETLTGESTGLRTRLAIGIADTLPKELVYRLLAPALALDEPMRLVCEQGKPEHLLAQLGVHAFDLVLADAPVGPFINIRAFNHLLGECSVCLLGTADLAAAYRRGFPQSLDGAPFLLPTENTLLRRALEQWFTEIGIRPKVRGEFADSTLLKVFGQHGAGIFAVRTAVERETQQAFKVQAIGQVDAVRERVYAITLERKSKHPAVAAIIETARTQISS